MRLCGVCSIDPRRRRDALIWPRGLLQFAERDLQAEQCRLLGFHLLHLNLRALGLDLHQSGDRQQ